jgi:hypothetical protein
MIDRMADPFVPIAHTLTSPIHQPFQSYPCCLESGLFSTRHAFNRFCHSALILIRHAAT